MGWTYTSCTFSLLTDAHAGVKEAIDDALAAQFLRDVQVLADAYNDGRERDIVTLGWDYVSSEVVSGE